MNGHELQIETGTQDWNVGDHVTINLLGQRYEAKVIDRDDDVVTLELDDDPDPAGDS